MGVHQLYVALSYGGQWVDVSADVLQNEAVEITRGVGDESGGLRPIRTTLRLRDLAAAAPAYDPDDPSSPLYGLAGRNTHMLTGFVIAAESFETGPPYAFAFANGGAAAWAPSTTLPHSGTRSLKSGTIANSQTSDFDVTVPAGANGMQFWYRIDAQNPGDGLQVIVNPGANQAVYVNHSVDPWTQLTVPVTPGGLVRFRYTKDAAGSAGADAAWIDDLLFLDVESLTEVAVWAPDRTEVFAPQTPGPGKGMRWTDVEAEGILRRIAQWTDPLASPMYANISARDKNGRLLGYWPGEGDQPTGSSVMPAANAGGLPAVVRGVVDFGAGGAPPGSQDLAEMGAGGLVVGKFRRGSSTSGWQISFAFRLDAAPASRQVIATWTTSNGYVYTLECDNVNVYVKVLDAERLTLYDNGVNQAGQPFAGNWVVFRVKVTASGGTVTLEPAWYGVTFNSIWGWTTTFAGTTGYLTTWRMAQNPNTDKMGFGHVYAVESGVDNLLSEAGWSIIGFEGETAAARFLRLCGDNGIIATVTGVQADTSPMGAQPVLPLQDQFQEIATTEDGLITDIRFAIGLNLRTRRSMLNQTPKLTLTRAQCAPPLRKSLGDKLTANVITAKSRNGQTAVASRTSGPMSTLTTFPGVGAYPKTVDGNWSSTQRMSEVAGWHLSKGTDPAPRYTSVTIDFDAQPSLEAAASLVDPGDLIVLTDVTPEALPLIVLGATGGPETKFRRRITFTCVPAAVYEAAVYNAAGSRYDSATTTMIVATAAGDPSLPITSTDVNDAWVNPASIDPRTGLAYGQYDWLIAGERVTVTAVSAPSGTGPITQLATVTRAVNGVAKTLPAGATVSLADPVRYAP